MFLMKSGQIPDSSTFEAFCPEDSFTKKEISSLQIEFQKEVEEVLQILRQFPGLSSLLHLNVIQRIPEMCG